MNLVLLLLAIIAIYIIFAPRLAAWFYRPILFPRIRMASHMEAPHFEGIKGEAVNFKQVSGNKLYAWFFRVPQARFTILVSHGNFGNIETHSYLGEALVKAGYSVFMYDYSGYGASTGLPDLTTVIDDAQAAYDYLIESQKLQAQNIILYGESIGAAISAHLATVRQARALICQSGFVSLRTIATEKLPMLRLYPDWLFPSHTLHTLNSLRNVSLPVLIMHGQKDSIVPFHHAQILYQAAQEPKRLVPFSECGHRNVSFANPDYFSKTVQNFIQTIYDQALNT